MPTNYPGDSTATQSPSAPPNPEEQITVALPADLDPPNASTFEQAFKVLADFVAWLFTPIAKALDFEGRIMGWRSATGHTRFSIDHLGFPSGQHVHVSTYWCTSDPVGPGADFTGAGSNGVRLPTDPKWVYGAAGSAVGIDGIELGQNPNGPTCTLMQLTALPAAVSGNYVVLSAGPYGRTVPWMHIAFDCLASGIDSGHSYANLDFASIGLGEWGGVSGVGLNDFIGFETRNGTTWQCVTRAAGVETVTNTLINIVRDPYNPAGAPIQRLRVEFHGESVAEDGNRRVRFYVDSALVATHSAHIPAGAKMHSVLALQRGPSAADPIAIGPVNVHMSLFPADVS